MESADWSVKYYFSEYVLDDELLELHSGDRGIPVEPQVFSLLRHLIENRDHVVSKDNLIEHVWNGRIVSDATLTSRINLARHAVGDSGKRQHTIKTYPKQGFRFVAEVKAAAGTPPQATASTRHTPEQLSATRPRQRSVAIMPFENHADDAEHGHIAAGISEELSIALGRVKWLRVVPFSTVRALHAEGRSASDIAGEFSVRYVLEGSIRANRETIRVTCRLTDCENDRHLWGDHFEDTAERSFALQSTLARRISAELDQELVRAEASSTERISPSSFEAWDHYLRALAKVHLVEKEANAAARRELEAAIALDPDFAPAHSQLAWCHSMEAIHRWTRPGMTSLAAAQHHAERAVAIDPYDPLAFCAMSLVHFWQGDQIKALTAARQASELDRGSRIAQGLIGCTTAVSGAPEVALPALDEAMKGSLKDPLRWFWMQGRANACFALERCDEASDWARNVIELRPKFVFGYVIHAASSALGNRPDEARHSVERLRDIVPDYCIRRFRTYPMWSDRKSIDRLAVGLEQAGLPETA